MTLDKDCVKFVMSFYNVSEADALRYYRDEIDAYKRLLTRFNDETFSTGHRNNDME
jgi:hypothetical protein